MNVASLTGFIFCFVVILIGVATNGGISSLINYLHLPSLLVTVGGSFMAVLASSDSFKDYLDGLKGFPEALKKQKVSTEQVSGEIIRLSNLARKEGLLGLEKETEAMQDPFMKKGIMLIVDGAEPELVKDILETDMVHKENRNYVKVHFWQDMGTMAPAWGMVGTLLGLVNMMLSMANDTSKIGEGMALALITTLYGSVLSNWICAPIVRKMKKNNDHEMLLMELVIEGVLSIQAGENPQVIKEKLKSFEEEKRLAEEAA